MQVYNLCTFITSYSVTLPLELCAAATLKIPHLLYHPVIDAIIWSLFKQALHWFWTIASRFQFTSFDRITLSITVLLGLLGYINWQAASITYVQLSTISIFQSLLIIHHGLPLLIFSCSLGKVNPSGNVPPPHTVFCPHQSSSAAST